MSEEQTVCQTVATPGSGLELLRAPFPAHQISQLPKPTKAQNESKDKKLCPVCGTWHDPKVIHLSYVGHAALTDRLLDADPLWYWEPVAYTEQGLPLFDDTGGLWIRLTLCGHSRLGYGNAEKSQWKSVGDREKEVIGDALRNAAMRFGAALELWHKGDLHIEDTSESEFITDDQRIEIEKIVVDKGVDVEKFLQYMKVEDTATIPAKDYQKAIAVLKKAKGTKDGNN